MIRLRSIDILRALTMFFMLWVNDFWTLTDVPKWLAHAQVGEDYMGFSDIIFPLFLFIVGLSIPLAIQKRLEKKDEKTAIAKHILIRSLSLLFIGVFIVNYENIDAESLSINRLLWCFLMAAAVFLVWTNYSKSPIPKPWHTPLQIIGWLIFAGLALFYKGGENGELWMRPHWWGILGLIGWAYLVNALVFLFARGNLAAITILWLVLTGLSILSHTQYAINLSGLAGNFSVVLTGTIPAFTAAGMLTTLLLQKCGTNKQMVFTIFILLGIAGIAAGMATRPEWGISKVGATPSWLWICTGIGLLSFALLHFIVDIKKQESWAKILAPAGTATFTCYMLPYFIYPIRSWLGVTLPDMLLVGFIGLISSLLYALMVVIITGLLEKKGITLKL